MNKNSQRKFRALHKKGVTNFGPTLRKHKEAKVGRSGPDIARRLGHDTNPLHVL